MGAAASSDDELRRRIQRGMAMLRSEREGGRGVIEVVSCGVAAVPLLQDFARQRDPSGLYQGRCRAVEALAALGARNALADLLTIPLDRPDPVERTGDEAVVNAAARALIGSKDDGVFLELLHLARRRHLTGVIEALGSFGRPEAIPRLIDALAEDCSRLMAEAALQSFGSLAYPALWQVVRRPNRSVSELRQRRSAVRLLLTLGATPPIDQALDGDILFNPDTELSALANMLVLATADDVRTRRSAAESLIALLSRAAWPVIAEIEDALVQHATITAALVEAAIRCPTDTPAFEALRRIAARIGQSNTSA